MPKIKGPIFVNEWNIYIFYGTTIRVPVKSRPSLSAIKYRYQNTTFFIPTLTHISWATLTSSWSIDVKLTLAGYIGFGNGYWWPFFIWKSANTFNLVPPLNIRAFMKDLLRTESVYKIGMKTNTLVICKNNLLHTFRFI